MTRIWREC